MSEEFPQGRGGPGQFKPGKSGNPGGLPRWLKEFRDALKGVAPEGLVVVRRIYERANNVEALEKIINDGESSPEAVLKAEAALHDRLELAHKVNAESWKYLLPKPTLKHKVSGELGNPMTGVSTEDIQAFIRATKGEGK